MKHPAMTALSTVEAIVNGVFGTVLCVFVAMMPLLMVELQIPFLPRGPVSVILILAASVSIEARNIWRIWVAFLDPKIPPGPSAALRLQQSGSVFFRLPSIFWFSFHTFVAMNIIGLCKYKAFHGAVVSDRVMGIVFGLVMFGALNIFVTLTVKAVTNRNDWVMTTWKYRFAIDLAFEGVVLAIG